MISIITGDVINSQKVSPHIWLQRLKLELDGVGKSPLTWEIYRGDSFQVEVTDPSRALLTAIKIKAAIKSINEMDVRLAIGVGNKTYEASKITESNGSAFVYSGETYESLVKSKQNLAIATPSNKLNQEMNLLFRFALIVMDNWSVNSAKVVYNALTNPGYSQEELGKALNIKQNSVSSALKRACFSEISDMLVWYQNKIKEVI